MKKYFLCAFAILSIYTLANAQNITKIEYYIDTDPGFGVATGVHITAATPINRQFR
jgi:hypothetical protein